MKVKLAEQSQKKRKSRNSGPSVLRTLSHWLFWLVVLFTMLGYGALRLQESQQPFQATAVGRLAAKAGLEAEVQDVVVKMASIYNSSIR